MERVIQIKNCETNGKVHVLKRTLRDGTNLTACGLAQQKPFTNSTAKNVCYGRWEKVFNRKITCKKCDKMTA